MFQKIKKNRYDPIAKYINELDLHPYNYLVAIFLIIASICHIFKSTI